MLEKEHKVTIASVTVALIIGQKQQQQKEKNLLVLQQCKKSSILNISDQIQWFFFNFLEWQKQIIHEKRKNSHACRLGLLILVYSIPSDTAKTI